ncbi:bifunctional epoxide hydrolase 2 [Xyrichtys novacula]|uniref:Bifunctional epoxide hydrolase 2 n=1 Tax=Xyrichtys novacula TaxID=13765 RepID=A0AAV1HPF2_XYRNO|nr:bifunctional epoxide hydrolase 2 [Xyrichtys novacula]
MVPALEAEYAKEAQVRRLTLPSDWSVKVLLEELREKMMDIQAVVLQTAARLHQNGLLTAVLANHWVDDSSAGDHPACLLSQLGSHFDLVLQVCRAGHRVPEPEVFTSALQHLGVTSEQVEDTPTQVVKYMCENHENSQKDQKRRAEFLGLPMVGCRGGGCEGSQGSRDGGHLGGESG